MLLKKKPLSEFDISYLSWLLKHIYIIRKEINIHLYLVNIIIVFLKAFFHIYVLRYFSKINFKCCRFQMYVSNVCIFRLQNLNFGKEVKKNWRNYKIIYSFVNLNFSFYLKGCHFQKRKLLSFRFKYNGWKKNDIQFLLKKTWIKL